nr:trypsin-like serine protease [Streptomyces sp. ST1020]
MARHAPAAGSRVRVYGHGLTKPPTEKDPNPVGDVLRRADMKVIGDRTCTSRLAGVVDGTSVLCAQAPQATICAGDSGGPLLKRGRRGPELAGIVSFGSEVLDKECVHGHPSAFADAAKLRGWLTQPRPVLVPMPAGKLTVTGRQQAGSKLTCRLPRWAGKVSRPGYGGLALVPVSEGLAGGEAGPLAAGVQVGAVAAGGLFGQQDADNLGGVPSLGLGGGDDVGQRPADMREFEPAGQFDGLGERVAVGAGNGAKRGGHQSWSLSSYSETSEAVRLVPKVDQAEVPGCSEWFSLRRTGSACWWTAW